MKRINFFPNYKYMALISTFLIGVSCLPLRAEASKDTQSTKDQPSEHPIRDAAIEAGKKTAEVAGELATRARKGIHAATEDLKKDEEGSSKSEKRDGNENDAEEKTEAETDKISEKTKEAYHAAKKQAQDTYEGAKDKVKEGAEKAKDKASEVVK